MFYDTLFIKTHSDIMALEMVKWQKIQIISLSLTY